MEMSRQAALLESQIIDHFLTKIHEIWCRYVEYGAYVTTVMIKHSSPRHHLSGIILDISIMLVHNRGYTNM